MDEATRAALSADQEAICALQRLVAAMERERDALKAEAHRLRTDYAILSDDYRAVQGRAAESYAAGQAAERRAVMAWLHRLVAPGVRVGDLEALADAIEGGDHHR